MAEKISVTASMKVKAALKAATSAADLGSILRNRFCQN
jgi:hypothetical protein